MRIKVYILVVLAVVLFMVSIAPQVLASADSAESKEHQIKAAFLYNFIKFVDWPEDEIADSNDAITIGIIGKDPFEDAFEPIKAKKVKDKKLIIKQFPPIASYKTRYEKDKYKAKYKADYSDALKRCHLLFISSSEKEHIEEIISFVEGGSVLTVGETAGFLEAGGMINFVMDEAKVRFEINNAAAKRSKLKVRSALLRLAKRVVEKDGVEDNNTEASEGAGN